MKTHISLNLQGMCTTINAVCGLRLIGICLFIFYFFYFKFGLLGVQLALLVRSFPTKNKKQKTKNAHDVACPSPMHTSLAQTARHNMVRLTDAFW